VSSIQTGELAGPVGDSVGQHRFRDGLVVREAQPTQALYTPVYGLFELRARALDDPASMVALWMIGFEDQPNKSSEICVSEIFGRDVGPSSALVGVGVHPHGDASIVDDFERVDVAIDVREPHEYATEWTHEWIAFYVDERRVKVVRQSIAYPMQFLLSVYEFRDDPGQAPDPDRYPKVFEADWFRGSRRLASPDKPPVGRSA